MVRRSRHRIIDKVVSSIQSSLDPDFYELGRYRRADIGQTVAVVSISMIIGLLIAFTWMTKDGPLDVANIGFSLKVFDKALECPEVTARAGPVAQEFKEVAAIPDTEEFELASRRFMMKYGQCEWYEQVRLQLDKP